MGGVGNVYSLPLRRGTKTSTAIRASSTAKQTYLTPSGTTKTATKFIMKRDDYDQPYSITLEEDEEGVRQQPSPYSGLKVYHHVPKVVGSMKSIDDPGKYILLDETHGGKKLAICQRNPTNLTSYQVVSVSSSIRQFQTHLHNQIHW